MKNSIYYNKFKEDLKEKNIEIIIDRYGFFNIKYNKEDFIKLSKTEDIGLKHILDYDYIKISENKYRLIRRLDSFSIKELEEELLNEINID